GTHSRSASENAPPPTHAETATRSRRPPVHAGADDDVAPNTLRIGLVEPYIRLTMNIHTADRTLTVADLDMNSTPPRRPAYANLLVEMAARNTTLSIRADETEEHWRIVEPVLRAWAAKDIPMREYPAGSGGPTAARSTDTSAPR